MNLRQAMCEALVDGWVSNWAMCRVITHAWILTNEEPKDDDEKWSKARAALRVSWLSGSSLAKTWIPKNMPRLNEALWAGLKRDTCIARAKKELGIHNGVGVNLMIGVRERDNQTGWGVTK